MRHISGASGNTGQKVLLRSEIFASTFGILRVSPPGGVPNVFQTWYLKLLIGRIFFVPCRTATFIVRPISSSPGKSIYRYKILYVKIVKSIYTYYPVQYVLMVLIIHQLINTNQDNGKTSKSRRQTAKTEIATATAVATNNIHLHTQRTMK